MTTAQLVNLILDKLRTGRVEFVEFVTEYVGVKFDYGSRRYLVVADGDSVRVFVGITLVDDYSCWIEGVLNGKTRNEEGVLA